MYTCHGGESTSKQACFHSLELVPRPSLFLCNWGLKITSYRTQAFHAQILSRSRGEKSGSFFSDFSPRLRDKSGHGRPGYKANVSYKKSRCAPIFLHLVPTFTPPPQCYSLIIQGLSCPHYSRTSTHHEVCRKAGLGMQAASEHQRKYFLLPQLHRQQLVDQHGNLGVGGGASGKLGVRGRGFQ